ncbi:unnamed protein product [Haemonchus placei]|uniref:Uncharacterized protein n=1 Tax=Haemonchus placei TaxID=6290 RepID=A0A3P8BZ83_HAEPC|nr:unnamed protein product [Haemonchus placei]
MKAKLPLLEYSSQFRNDYSTIKAKMTSLASFSLPDYITRCTAALTERKLLGKSDSVPITKGFSWFTYVGSEENAKIEEIIRTTTAETTITSTATPLKPPTLPPMRPLPDLRIREGVNGTAIAERRTMAEEKTFRDGVDADLLNIGLATGAPLDLEAEGAHVVPYRTRNVPATTTSLPPAAVPVFHKAPHVRPKSTTKPKTAFERLAVDYKERLTGAGDMDKFLKSIYSNAYIALIDAKEAPNVRLPLNMRRAAGLYTQ